MWKLHKENGNSEEVEDISGKVTKGKKTEVRRFLLRGSKFKKYLLNKYKIALIHIKKINNLIKKDHENEL